MLICVSGSKPWRDDVSDLTTGLRILPRREACVGLGVRVADLPQGNFRRWHGRCHRKLKIGARLPIKTPLSADQRLVSDQIMNGTSASWPWSLTRC